MFLAYFTEVDSKLEHNTPVKFLEKLSGKIEILLTRIHDPPDFKRIDATVGIHRDAIEYMYIRILWGKGRQQQAGVLFPWWVPRSGMGSLLNF